MTLQPQNRFQCNRCGDHVYVDLQNTPARSAPPEGWTTLVIDNDNPAKAKPALHLCPPCAFGLTAYLDDATLDQARAASAPPAATA